MPIASCTAEASGAAAALGDANRSNCVGVAEIFAEVEAIAEVGDLKSEAPYIPLTELPHSREGLCLRSGEVSRSRGRLPSCSAVRDSTRAMAYSRHSRSKSRRASRSSECCSHHASLASAIEGVVGICIFVA